MRVCVCVSREGRPAERANFPPTVIGECLSAEVSRSVPVCVWRKRVVFPHRRLSLGIAFTQMFSFLLLIKEKSEALF